MVKDTILRKSKVLFSEQGTWEGAGVPKRLWEQSALRCAHTITTMVPGRQPGCPSSQGTGASQGSEVSQPLDGNLCPAGDGDRATCSLHPPAEEAETKTWVSLQPAKLPG